MMRLLEDDENGEKMHIDDILMLLVFQKNLTALNRPYWKWKPIVRWMKKSLNAQKDMEIIVKTVREGVQKKLPF